jgi:hypothetical protein
VFTRPQLHSIGAYKYKWDALYVTDEHNQRGLFGWEIRAIEKYFAGCECLLLTAAGGGREVLALRRLGIKVQGVESDERLMRFANDLMEREGLSPDIKWAPWDHLPELREEYDGVVVGWGGYMLIRGKNSRVMYLRRLRERVAHGAPILLSFFTTGHYTRGLRAVAKLGNLVARTLGREAIELGDSLLPNYVHFFTQEQLENELQEGGFELICYERYPFGHGIGRAI